MIQQARDIQEDHRRDGKVKFWFNRNLTVISCISISVFLHTHRETHAHYKFKVVPLLFNRAPRLEGVLGEWRHAFLISALDGGEWSALRPGRFTLRERAPDTHWIEGWVGSSADLGTVVKIEFPTPCRDWNRNPRSSIPLKYSDFSRTHTH
jgi:hypothetical protein